MVLIACVLGTVAAVLAAALFGAVQVYRQQQRLLHAYAELYTESHMAFNELCELLDERPVEIEIRQAKRKLQDRVRRLAFKTKVRWDFQGGKSFVHNYDNTDQRRCYGLRARAFVRTGRAQAA